MSMVQSLFQILKAELYKDSRRKSSWILVVPMLLTAVVTIGYCQGFIQMAVTGQQNEALSCLDFVCMVWSVLSGLGIVGILLYLFAAFQFSGEIERGQIKLMLLRTGRRGQVVLGKYLAVVLVSAAAVLGVFLVAAAGYYLMVVPAELGTGSFSITMSGMSDGAFAGSVLLQFLVYCLWIAAAFLAGIYAGPFVSFVIAMVAMYAGNAFSGMETAAAKWFAGYWSNQMLMGADPGFAGMGKAVFCTFAGLCVILFLAAMLFEKRDIK